MQLRTSSSAVTAACQLLVIDNATLQETRHVLNRPSGLKVWLRLLENRAAMGLPQQGNQVAVFV